MGMTNSISDRINALKIEAGEHGDTAQVAMCVRAAGHELYASSGSGELSPEELFPSSANPIVPYVAAICESLDVDQLEGHIRTSSGRQVYVQ
jgi:hypothetical protein